MRHVLFSALVLLIASRGHAGETGKLPPMPEAFSSFGAAISDGYVYVYGGHTGRTHTYSTEAVTGKFRRLSLAHPEKGWEELAPDLGLQGLALVAHGGKLYRIGGMNPRNQKGDPSDNYSVASCKVYDPKTGNWSPLPDMPAGRSSHDACVVGDKIVVAGGWQMKGQDEKSTWHNTALILDLSKKPLQWQSVPQPFNRRALSVVGNGDQIYVLGGLSGSMGRIRKGEKSDDKAPEIPVNIYNLATGKWSMGPSIPGSRMNGFSPAACVTDGTIYLSPSSGAVYKMTRDAKGWQQVGMLAERRLVHRVLPIANGRLLVLGGASKGGNLDSLEVINPQAANAATSAGQ